MTDPSPSSGPLTPDQRTEALDALAEDFVASARRGEAPTVEAYAEAHPALAEDIRRLFPLLPAVETWADSYTEVKRPDAMPAPPAAIEGYRLERELGRGGMGRVFLARSDDPHEDAVAIKLIHPHLATDERYIVRFLREAEAGRRVRHPNVVRTLAVGTQEIEGVSAPYLVLEFVEGQNLREMLDELGPLPERLCRTIGQRVAEGLAAVHEQEVLHRDVKPENVVVTPSEVVKLMDLGVAALQDEVMRISTTGEFVGSLLYAAPEQFTQRETLDARADLYGLGLLMYELATGAHPSRHAGEHWVSPAMRVGFVAALRAVDARLSPFFDTVVRKLLSHDRDDRFASAAQVAELLREGESSTWWQQAPESVRQPNTEAWAGALVADRPTQFHGRTREREILNAALVGSRKGAGRWVRFVGEAGIGKSRLVREWVDHACSVYTQVRVLVLTHAPDHAWALPSLTLALRRSMAGHDVDTRTRELLGDEPALADAFLRFQSGESTATDAVLATAHVELILRMARRRPLIVVAEDLHFATQRERDLVHRVARSAGEGAFLLVTTERPDATTAWPLDLERVTYAERVDLGGLDADAARAVVREIVAEENWAEALTLDLPKRCDGNPFLLVESARALRDGELVEERAPASVRRALAAPLAALSVPERELLDVAACDGFAFDPGRLARVADLGEIAVLKTLLRIERDHDLVRAEGRSYHFRHHMVQEVVRDELPQALREAYQRAIADDCVATEKARTPDVAAWPVDTIVAICERYVAAGDIDAAMPFVAAAIQRLADESEYGRIHALMRRAGGIDAIVERISGLDRISVLTDYGESGLHATDSDEPDRALVLAYEEADELGLHEFRCRARNALGLLRRLRGDPEGSREIYQESVDIARKHDCPSAEAYALSGLAFPHIGRGEFTVADALLRESLRLAREVGGQVDVGWALNNLGHVLWLRERRDDAIELLDEALATARKCGDRQTEANATSNRANVAVRFEGPAPAAEQFRRAADLAEQVGIPPIAIITRANAAYEFVEMGRFDEARRDAGQSFAVAESISHKEGAVHSRMPLVEVDAARGNLEAALEGALYGRRVAASLAHPLLRVRAEHALVRLFHYMGRPKDARDAAARLWRAARIRSGMREQAMCVLGYAQVAGRRVPGRVARYLEATIAPLDATDAVAYQDVLRLALARVLPALDRGEEAEPVLADAIRFATRRDAPPTLAPALALHAGYDANSAPSARLLLERETAAIPILTRIDAWFSLWSATGARGDLARTQETLEELFSRVSEEVRQDMRTHVPLFRNVLSAATSRS